LNKQILNVVKYIVLLGIAAVLLWLAFKGVDLNATFREISHANLFWLFVSVAASLVAFVSRSIRWNMLIHPLGYRPKLGNTNAALMIGYLANLAVPRLGEVSRCGTLNRAEKVPFDALIGTVIIERAIDVLCLLGCIVLTASMEYTRLGNFLNQNLFDPMQAKASTLLGSTAFVIFAISVPILVILLIIVAKRKKHGIVAKVSNLFKGIVAGLATIKKVKSPFWFLFHTFLIWFMYFMMSYTCFKALESTAALGWQAGLFILVAGGMGMSAPVQGGIGAYHLLVSQGLMLYGVAREHGLAFATLMHASQTLVVILLGGFAFLYLAIKRKDAAVHT
jgi:glycosyltransferase 2 family protein